MASTLPGFKPVAVGCIFVESNDRCSNSCATGAPRLRMLIAAVWESPATAQKVRPHRASASPNLTSTAATSAPRATAQSRASQQMQSSRRWREQRLQKTCARRSRADRYSVAEATRCAGWAPRFGPSV
eukprot:5703785-Prymnesium_polylepis.1